MSPEQPSRARRLLFLDTLGASLTAVITLGLLASGVIQSGVPAKAWWVLGAVAAAMAFAGGVALRRRASPAMVLPRLALANLAYAVASVLVVLVWRDSVTGLVVAYVASEATVLGGLAIIEWRESRRAS